MSNPFSGIPDPGMPRPIRRRFQPGVVQETLGAALGVAREAVRRAQRYGKDLWLRGKRNPRAFALIGGAVALTLVGAYALSASGAGRSLCPPTGDRKTPPHFFLLMDPVPHLTAGSELEIRYDVCGLTSGTPYRGRVRLAQERAGGKKGSPKPKPLVVTFQDRVDGLATRRHQELDLASTRPGPYILELSVVDNQGRERKRLQKLLIKVQ